MMDEGGATHIICLLCRAFGIVLYSTLVFKQERHGCDRWITPWVKSLLVDVVVTKSRSKWKLIARDVAQRSELEPALTPLSVTWPGDQGHPQKIHTTLSCKSRSHTGGKGCQPGGPGIAWRGATA